MHAFMIFWYQKIYARARCYMYDIRHSNSTLYRYELIYKASYVYI